MWALWASSSICIDELGSPGLNSPSWTRTSLTDAFKGLSVIFLSLQKLRASHPTNLSPIKVDFNESNLSNKKVTFLLINKKYSVPMLGIISTTAFLMHFSDSSLTFEIYFFKIKFCFKKCFFPFLISFRRKASYYKFPSANFREY